MDPFAVLLADATNGFNELNRKAMLWTVRHLWPAGARFAFNCYRHHATLVCRKGGNSANCYRLYSKEGVTQGDPLAMVLYGLAMVPLSKQLREEFPQVLQAWYADDAAVEARCSQIGKYQTRLRELGPSRGYYSNSEKSIVITRPEDRDAA